MKPVNKNSFFFTLKILSTTVLKFEQIKFYFYQPYLSQSLYYFLIEPNIVLYSKVNFQYHFQLKIIFYSELY